jgi:NADPH:quinone reductase-like Zn-dependent oxidoreductase
MTPTNSPPLTMKAWIAQGYGGPEVLALKDRRRPVPGAGEVLVRICATTVTAGDVRVRSLNIPRGLGIIARFLFGFFRPRQPVFGSEFSGVVEAVGNRVTAFKPGDAVVGFTGVSLGCHAQYVTMPAGKTIAHKPGNLSFQEAAGLCFGGTTAIHFLRKARLTAGEKVLVIGASGAVGSAIVQLAALEGAEVTGVTSSRNVALVRSLGASAVVDYTTHDYGTLGQTYDVIADTVGGSSFRKCLPLLNEHGRYLAVAADLTAMLARPVGTKQPIAGHAFVRVEDVATLCKLAECGDLMPLIDSVYDFSQMPEAHAYVETRRKRGSVIVSVSK